MLKCLIPQRVINDLPAGVREQVLKDLIAGDSSRKISAMLAEHGHKISFAAIARYRRTELAAMVAQAEQVQQMQRLSARDPRDVDSLAKITNRGLLADPIMDRVQNKYVRYDRWLSQAEESKDFAALSSIDKAETATLRLDAELSGRLQQASSLTQVAIVISKQEYVPGASQGECLEIKAIPD